MIAFDSLETTLRRDAAARASFAGMTDEALVRALFTASDRPRRYDAAARRAMMREAAVRLRAGARP